MTLHYTEPYHRHIDYLVKLAAAQIDAGVVEEPRSYFDIIRLNDFSQPTPGAPNVFINGEKFPVMITHLSAALIPQFDASPVAIGDDERFIQRVGMRLTFHDQFYQGAQFVPMPLWHNEPVAASDLVTQGASSIVFRRPVILSARDSLRVTCGLAQVPASARNATVSFTGTGMLSRRPYFFSGTRQLDSTVPTQLPSEDYRNDGAEPVALTDMSIFCGPEVDAAVGQGDIRQMSLNVRQVGNGTNADWFDGPPTFDVMPAVLAGYTTGRCIVHRLPGDGLIWEPGEGVTLDLTALDASVNGFDVGVSLHGFLSVV